jgi:hypothetical protein
MSEHRFAAGQLVHFNPTFSQDRDSGVGLYEILRQMPIERADETSYRIKNQSSGQERIASEHQLELAI